MSSYEPEYRPCARNEGQVLAEKTDPPSITLRASDLQKFAGTYRLKDSEPTCTLTVVNGRLIGARSGGAESEWNAETRDVFFVKGDPRIRKIFRYDANGVVTGFVEYTTSRPPCAWTPLWLI